MDRLLTAFESLDSAEMSNQKEQAKADIRSLPALAIRSQIGTVPQLQELVDATVEPPEDLTVPVEPDSKVAGAYGLGLLIAKCTWFAGFKQV